MFLFKLHRDAIPIAAAVFLALSLAGCAGNTEESYRPAGDHAREALMASLEAWKSGKAADTLEPLPNGGPKLQAIDSDWRSGKRLASFEITGELPKEESATRPFSVKLQIEGAAAPQDAVYHVVGKDPLWIFRDKDYGQPRGM